ncbi:MAG: hypothetical protein ABL307_00015 [Roseitalea porphyridii]|uniref:hypothetical protein n=1 Tax=Roseitalea porphyridii TaxID=1852022 RepID=UPI0032D913B5
MTGGFGKRRRNRAPSIATALFALLALAACQTADTLSIDEVAPSRPAETFGEGQTVIALLAERSAGGETGAAAEARVNGARLALEQLGGGALTLRIDDIGTTADGARAGAAAARQGGAVLLAGTSTVRQSAAAAPGAGGPPLIAFISGATGPASNVFPFVSDTVDSLLEGVRLTVGANQSRFVVIHPADTSAADLARLRAGIGARGGTFAGAIAYPVRSGAVAGTLAAQEATIDGADVAIVMGRDAAAGAVLDALASGEVGGSLAAKIGQADWPDDLLARPSAQGVLIAREPPPSLALIDEAYRARFGRAPDRQAAFGFDVVAIAAGLARGGSDIDRAALTADKGFRGLTGLFRFRADGRVERRHVLYRFADGGLTVVQEAGTGF